MRRNTIITVLSVAALGWTAQAQPEEPGLLGGPDQDFMKQTDQGPRGARRGGSGAPRMTAEEAVAVWTIQASSVATSLDLNAEQASQLTQAYIAQRESIHAAMQAKRGEARGNRQERGARRDQAKGQGQGKGRGQGRSRPGMNEELRAMMDAENAVFESALTGFMSNEQAARAVTTLGRPNRGWDQMVRAIIGFELDSSSQTAAVNAIASYVNTTADLRPMRENGDREITKAALTEARETLRTELEGMLSEEELDVFAASLDPRGRRGERGPRDGRGFERLDVNGDGVLQKDELPARMQERFAELDANGDGELDASEMQAMRGGEGGRGPGRDGARRGGPGRGAVE